MFSIFVLNLFTVTGQPQEPQERRFPFHAGSTISIKEWVLSGVVTPRKFIPTPLRIRGMVFFTLLIYQFWIEVLLYLRRENCCMGVNTLVTK
jgi:hypothetical protein